MMKNLFCVKDRVVAITGATGVLGRSMVLHFAEQGARVVLMGRKAETGLALQREAAAAGGDALFVAADVLNKEDIERAYSEIMERYGRIDVLINGAGGNMPGATIAPDKTIFDLDMKAFRDVVDLNLFGTVLPTMAFARAMVAARGGSIINIASESAIRPLSRVAGYGVAKAAVVNFTKYLCGELALKYGDGFRVNAIAPGFFLTEQNRALLTTPAGRRQEVRITAEDDCGNRSVLAFTVEGKADERSFHAPACDSLPVVRHDRDFHREGDGVRIEIPAGTLYESCFYTQRPHDEPQPKDSTLLFLSRGVEILDVRLPMHRYATLWIDATQVPPELRRYAVLASLSPKGKLRYEGGKWSDGRIRLRTRSLGTFFVVADTVRPTIRPRFTAHDLSGQRSVTFSVSDNFSGVGSVSCLVDGRMAILEENRVKGTYTHYFDDELFGRNREHTLRLTATDGAGNTRVWEGTYYR